jgi:hypothetical protein
MSGEWTLLILDLIGAFGLASGLLVVIRRLRQSHHSEPKRHCPVITGEV